MNQNPVKPSFYRRHKDAFTAAFILTPMLLWWIAGFGFPAIFAFGLGFFEWKVVNKPPTFVGFKNFITFFNPHDTYLADLWRTVWIGVGSTALIVSIALGVAILLNMPIKMKGIFRSFWYLPAVTSTVAVTQIILLLLMPTSGINKIIRDWFGIYEPIVLTTSIGWSVAVIMIFSLWRSLGSNAILWLAGLQSVEPVLYEAASIDGATRIQQFWHVTLPGLKPMATYVIIMGIIGSLQIYEPVAFITNGGPNNQTRVLTMRILQDGYTNNDFGMAGASGLVLALIIFISSAAYFFYSGREARAEAGGKAK